MLRVAVIGAGASGLSAIKACKEAGLEPTCFERSGHFGGLWRYREDLKDGQGSVMKSTVINTSKEMMSFSDFPVPEDFPIFMHNTQVYEYLKLYSEHFHLLPHIQYNTEVVYVTKADGCDVKYGKWRVNTKDLGTQEVTSHVFDYIMVCTGHHANTYRPKFPGIEDFKGKIIHSHDYRNPKGFEDKKIVIVGIGNSGGDIANELSRVASKVYLSTRQGTWIFNRVSDRGLPLDMLFTRRWSEYMRQSDPYFWLLNKIAGWKINLRFDHNLYCLKPNYGPLQQHPMVNDDLPNWIICGAVVVKSDVKTLTRTGVEFIDGTYEDDVDVLVSATGYSFGFPFIDPEILDVKDNEINLYMNTFLPDLERPTMAVIGCVQGFGSITPATEMQARAACQVFKGNSFLPSRREMWRDIKAKNARNERRYAKSRRHTIQVEILEFMGALAELSGCVPDYWHLWSTDPLLAIKVIFGPMTPYQLRLYGPYKWAGARNAIMTQWDRIYKPLRTRPVAGRTGVQTSMTSWGWWVVKVVISFLLVFFVLDASFFFLYQIPILPFGVRFG